MKKRKIILSCMLAVMMVMAFAVPMSVYADTNDEETNIVRSVTDATVSDDGNIKDDIDKADSVVSKKRGDEQPAADSSKDALNAEDAVKDAADVDKDGTVKNDKDGVAVDKYIIIIEEGNEITLESGDLIGEEYDLTALYWGATYKAQVGGTVYYYMDETVIPSDVEAERIGYSIDLVAITPSGYVDWDNYDRVAVPAGKSVRDLEEMIDEDIVYDLQYDGYDFLKWYKADYEDVDQSGKIVGLKYTEAFDFDTPVNNDVEVFAAWNKSENNIATQQTDEKVVKDSSPKTGDDFNMFIFAGAALLAALIAAVVVITGRRQKKHN